MEATMKAAMKAATKATTEPTTNPPGPGAIMSEFGSSLLFDPN
jgi:hypothetical protein